MVRTYGGRDLLRCVSVADPSGATIVLPQWMFDPVACAAMRRASDPSVCIAALEELRQLLVNAGALDFTRALRETRAHEQASSPSDRPTEPIAPASMPSCVEQRSRGVPPGGRRATRGAAETARVDRRGSEGERR
jgi:hypothetical protein